MSADAGVKKGFMSWYFQSNLLIRILIGLVLGAVVGIALGAADPALAKGFSNNARFFGDLFIRLLKMIMVPVVFFSLVGGAASIAPSHLGRVGVKILAFYLITSAVAVLIGLILANFIQPGLNFNVAGDPAAQVTVRTAPSLGAVILAIIPTNPVESLAKGDVLPIIFFSICFGVAISLVKDATNAKTAQAAEVLFETFTAAADTMYKIVAGVMQYAPVGVFVLIAIVFAEQGSKAIGPLLLVTLTVYIGLTIHLVVCYGGCLGVFGLGLGAFLRKATQPMITAFVTRSSSGTLPITLRATEERMGAPRSIASFSLPLGATINMDGTAIYLGVCAMFIGYATNAPLTLAQQAIVVVTATLASIGTAGVPGAGAIMLLMVMESIGMEVQAGTAIAAAYAMILGIDALLDMGRTSLNVTGDMVGTVIIAKQEKTLDQAVWDAK
ncbi:MAG: dicarboxylate/amino acid:cation symporter [Planctomycetota bacterium]|jgi:Na+/H+-dicarboxylate symporter|nr:dicarboxylate/amino acid:cation symporter [Planctomycetota bacterium]